MLQRNLTAWSSEESKTVMCKRRWVLFRVRRGEVMGVVVLHSGLDFAVQQAGECKRMTRGLEGVEERT
jgi:hypothetical protein